jgi:hypothetical protein
MTERICDLERMVTPSAGTGSGHGGQTIAPSISQQLNTFVNWLGP